MKFENYESRVHRIIANTLTQKINNSSLKSATISDVKLSHSRQKINVYISSANNKEIVKKLNKVKTVFRDQIAKNIQSKHTPSVNFEVDNLPDHIKSIEKTLEQIKHE
jgi:ribosome-binding factor A